MHRGPERRCDDERHGAGRLFEVEEAWESGVKMAEARICLI